MKNILISILWFFNVLAALAMLIAFAAPYVDPSIVAFPAFFGLAFPLILFVNVVFVIFWLFVKWKYLFLSLIIIILGYSNVKTYIRLSANKEEPGNVNGIKVITYNVRNFNNLGYKNNKNLINKIKTFLSEQDADVICLQESGNKSQLKFEGYQTVGDRANFILTKLKVIKTGYLMDANDYKFGVYADVIFQYDTIRLYNVQLLSYSVSRDIEDYEKEPEKVNPKQKVVTIAKKLKKGFTTRVNETYKLRKSLENSPYSVILCGDFNDPPASYTYRQIVNTGLKDAFVESGKGYGNTYNGYLPNMRIDYIFTSADIKIYNYKVFKVGFSDHFPVSALMVPEK